MSHSITANKHFTQPLLQWFALHGRKNLPWQTPRTAYRVWISEIMLQQTQVKTVIPYFTRFISRFPDIYTLATAGEDEVLALWSGLGYYSRARNLHKTAKIITNHYQGEFPDNLAELIDLPGIGASTAAAIASLAFNQSTAILDGNVKRVLSRFFLVGGFHEQAVVKQQLWQLANECMPAQNCAQYTQAIMDLGATCCTAKNPTCQICPVQINCQAYKHNLVPNFPNRKLKKKLEVKQQQFLLLHTHENLIYLEKQPPTGLWGGLWCMPTLTMEHCPLAYVNKTYALEAENPQELLAIKHTFSHFHLQIKALSIKTKLYSNILAETSGRWFHPQELSKIGLAKPVSQIINYFLNNSSLP